MFCIKCGRELKEDDKFCSSCGLPVDADEFTFEGNNQEDNIQPYKWDYSSDNGMHYEENRSNAYSKGTYNVGYTNQDSYQNRYQNGYKYSEQHSSYYQNSINGKVRFISFDEAMVNYLKGFINFNGRATRAEFWFVILFNVIVTFVLLGVSVACYGNDLEVIIKFYDKITLTYAFLTLLPNMALSFRRLHDTGRSGLWYFISVIPIFGTLVYYILMCMESDEDNEYGSKKVNL